jgi:hypothetical protein
MGRVGTLPRNVLAGAISQVKKRFKQLKSRYGPRYTKVMVGAAFVSLFSPIPGSVLVAVALIVAIAEVHRAISRRGGLRKTRAKEFVFSSRPATDSLCVPSLSAYQLAMRGSKERP